MNIFLFLKISGLIVNAAILVFIFAKLLNTKVGKAYFLITLNMTIWIFGNTLMDSSLSRQTALEWAKFTNIGAAFIAPSLIWFSLTLTNNDNIFRKVIIGVLVVISFIFSILSFSTDLVFTGIRETFWGYRSFPGVLFIPFTLYISICAIAAMILAIIIQIKSPDIQKKQIRLFIFAFAVPIIGGIFTEIFVPIFGLDIPPMTSLLFSFTGIIIAFAMTKYEFLSITPAIALQAVFDTMHDIVIAIDTFGNIKLINKSITATGYKPDDLINRHISDFFGENFSLDVVKQSLSSFPEGFSVTVVHRLKGQPIHFLVNGDTLLSSSGINQGLVLIVHDKSHTDELISHLKDKTAELEKSKYELQNNIQEIKRLNSFMINREIKMTELKDKIKNLERKIALSAYSNHVPESA